MFMEKFSKEYHITNGHISAEKKHYNSRVKPHCHDFFEFEYIVSGEGTYSIDGVEYEIKEKTLYFMTPVNFHSVDMKNTIFYNVMFSADMCNISILSRLFAKTPIKITVSAETHSFLCSMLEELTVSCDNIKYASLILETLITKFSLLAAIKEDRNISSDIRSTQLYILENFKRKLTLSDAAKYALLSESHFSRKFARECGKSFKEYLNSVRFEYAGKLLVYSDMTVMQICTECGFDDYPNFVRRFGQKMGMSPVNFRRKYSIDKT